MTGRDAGFVLLGILLGLLWRSAMLRFFDALARWRNRRRIAKLSRVFKILAPLANELDVSAEDLATYLPTLQRPLVGYDPITDSLYWVDRSISRAVYDDAKALGISLPAALVKEEDDGD